MNIIRRSLASLFLTILTVLALANPAALQQRPSAQEAEAVPKPAPCNIVQNGSFETTDSSKPAPGSTSSLTGVPGWRGVDALAVGLTSSNSPDVFTPTVGTNDVPDNFIGTQAAFVGANYAGISPGKYYGTFLSEALGGTLSSPVTTGTYNLSVNFSIADKRPTAAWVEILLHRKASNGADKLVVATVLVSSTTSWLTHTGQFTLPASNTVAYDEIVFRGAGGKDFNLSYVYIDGVVICPQAPPCATVLRPSVCCLGHDVQGNQIYAFSVLVNNQTGGPAALTLSTPHGTLNSYAPTTLPPGNTVVTGTFTDTGAANKPFCFKLELKSKSGKTCVKEFCLKMPDCPKVVPHDWDSASDTQ